MFDFFDEVVEFGNQVVYLLNYGISGINSFGSYISEGGTFLYSLLSGFPVLPSALFLILFGSDVFDFIRGR